MLELSCLEKCDLTIRLILAMFYFVNESQIDKNSAKKSKIGGQ